MEKNIKRQQITLEKGLTNNPNDAICSDNCLEYADGMIYGTGGYRPVQEPVVMFGGTGLPLLVHVHKTDAYTHYIGCSSNAEAFYWWTDDDTTCNMIDSVTAATATEQSVTSIGNTLIFNTGDEIQYALWQADDNAYYYLGNKIPEPKVRFLFYLGSEEDDDETTYEDSSYAKYVYHYARLTDIIKTSASNTTVSYAGSADLVKYNKFYLASNDVEQDDANNAVIGLYAENKADIAEKKAFCNPFFIRYALKMYDGSYIMHSVPQLMIPVLHDNTIFAQNKNKGSFLCARTDYRFLAYLLETDYTGWEDIIDGVDVFITDSIDIYNTSHDIIPSYEPDGSTKNKEHTTDYETTEIYGISTTSIRNEIIGLTEEERKAKTEWTHASGDYRQAWITYTYNCDQFMKRRTEDEFLNACKSASTFYYIFSCDKNRIGLWSTSANRIAENAITNLTTQTTLTDDYYSHCPLSADTMMMYNHRLHLGGITRGYWEGDDCFVCAENKTATTYRYVVLIKTKEGTRQAENTFKSYYAPAWYYFYPDPRATHVYIYNLAGDLLLSKDLEEHPFLNGAYFIEYPTEDTMSLDGTALDEEVTEYQTDAETLPNRLFVSEADNPFVFLSSGDYTIGTGKAIGISSITRPISQGQFGQYPCLYFATDGIWALSISDDGTYSTAHPVSREICSDGGTITQTDNAVFFVSARGLMVISEAEGINISCVSEQLNGRTENRDYNIKPFREFIDGCNIAYDYKNAMLWIIRKGYSYAYLYDIGTQTFSMSCRDSKTTFVAKANNYPDNILMTYYYAGSKRINGFYVMYSLYDIPNINDDDTDYTGILITRPMKLEDAFARKSIRDLRHVSDISSGTITLTLYASNDLKNWMQTNSLIGSGWKYYKAKLTFTDLKAYDTYSGMIIATQERYTDFMR